MTWIDKLERRFGRYGIPRLMVFLTGIMLAVYAADLVLGGQILPMLTFNRSLILQGEIWRVVTFLFLPPSSSPIWILFALYFYVIMGNSLESAWGCFRFNLFYLVGALAAILSGFLTGYASNGYLNMSLFLAFAALYPNHQVLVFFFLPLQVKWLALLDLVYYAIALVTGTWATRVGVLFAFLNVLLFFGGPLVRNLKQQLGWWKTRQQFRRNNRRW